MPGQAPGRQSGATVSLSSDEKITVFILKRFNWNALAAAALAGLSTLHAGCCECEWVGGVMVCM